MTQYIASFRTPNSSGAAFGVEPGPSKGLIAGISKKMTHILDSRNSKIDETDTIVLVHGTGAAAREDVGGRWWQSGSEYCTDLDQRLEPLARCVVNGEVFHWSGANSERDRHEASLDLLQNWLLRFEAESRPYHLIGHSHGGSVIWGALRESVRRGKPLVHLSSWSTVGTPFLHYRARRSDWLLVIPLMLGAILMWSLPQWSLTTWKHANEMMADGNFFAPIGLLLLSALAAVTLIYLTYRIAKALIVARHVAKGQQTEHRAMAIYGPRWLGLWSTDDEAINGLKNSVGFDARFSPQFYRSEEHAGATRRLLRIPIRVVGWCYDTFVSRPLDIFISDRIAWRLQGNNMAARILTAVTPTPIIDFHCNPLPAETSLALTERADAHAAATLRKVRKAFGITAYENEDTPVVVRSIASELTFQELVHTSYFDHPDIRSRLAEHITRHHGALNEDAATLREPSISHHGVASSASGDQSPARVRRGVLAASVTLVVLVLAPVLLVSVSTQAIYRMVVEYTDAYNVEAVLRDASITQIEQDRFADDDTKERAIRDWLAALVYTGRIATAEAAVSEVSKTGKATHDDMPSLWLATALARTGNWDEARRIASPITYGWPYERIVDYLIERGELDVARFMARLIPTQKDQHFPLSKVAIAYARAGQLNLSVGIMPTEAQDNLKELAEVLSESGDTDLALRVARSIQHGGSRAESLIVIAKLVLPKHSHDADTIANEALASAIHEDHVKDQSNPGRILAPVAVLFAENGFAQQSLTALDAIKSTEPERQSYAIEQRQRALEKVSVVLAEKGMAEEAKKTASQIAAPSDRDFAFGNVANALAALGRNADAIAMTWLIKEVVFRDSALKEVASTLAKSGLVDAALESAAKIKNPYTRFTALWNVANSLIEADKKESAKNVIDIARQRLAAVDEIQRFSHLPFFAVLLRNLGYESEALQAARDAVDAARQYYQANKKEYDDTLLTRAKSFSEAGFTEEAIALSKLIKNDGYRTLAQAGISAHKVAKEPDTVSIDEWISAWRARPASTNKDAEAESIASALIYAGQLDRLGELAPHIVNDDRRDRILLKVLGDDTYVDSNPAPPSISLSLMYLVHSPNKRANGILRIVGAGGLNQDETSKALRQVARDVDSVHDVIEKTIIVGRLAEQYVQIGELRRARFRATQRTVG